jgi:hypothetical protein
MHPQQIFSELLGFWTLSIVRYCKNTREHNVSETDPVSEILRSLVFFRTLDNGQSQKPRNSECYTLSSQPFRIESFV